jgi:SpoVK/Ycf46/Vps4 family AAA+-type ATPase
MSELPERPPKPEEPKKIEPEKVEQEKTTPVTQIVNVNASILKPSGIYAPSHSSGCMNGMCPICYPGRGGGGSYYTTSYEEFIRQQSQALNSIPSLDTSRMFEVKWDTTKFFEEPKSTPKPKAVPKSKPEPSTAYTEARKAVEEWIVPTPAQSFDDIIGNDEALSQLRDAIQAPVKHKKLYKAYGMKMPKGALLSGPPGCGKTMFARAAAAEMKRLYKVGGEFISAPASGLQASYVGETEQRIRAIFAYAREYKAFHGFPLLVFLDEAETLFPDRTGRIRRVFSYEEAQVSTFLAELDGVQECGAFVLLASNRPEVMDQALLRDGRCDFKVVIKRPNAAAVEGILRNNFKSTLTLGVEKEDLVFAALESLYDPSKIIAEAHAIGIDVEQLKFVDKHQKHFLLEHIISGAMAASIPQRATRYAFARDKTSGTALGVTVSDVITAVNDLFEENKRLEHSFAVAEFKEAFMLEAQKKVADK